MPATILVVADSEAKRSSIRDVLASSSPGFKVIQAEDGAEALVLALQGQVDVVVSDIIMPGLDGVELLRAIRQQREPDVLPVILVTSHIDHETRTISFEAGVNDYLYRPFSPAELLARVQVQLRVKKLQEELRRATELHRRLATHDELTGLANRRHLLDLARRELARSRRHKFSMSLVVVDADGFRRVNAKAGHLVGDAIIAELARIVERNLRSQDILARLSGGKFAALLPHTDIHQCSIVCGRLRESVFEYGFPSHRPGEVTVSVGIAGYPSGRLESVDELINAAESSIVRAKQMGGNRVEVWSGIIEGPTPR